MNKKHIGYLLLAAVGGYFIWKYFLTGEQQAGLKRLNPMLNFPLSSRPVDGGNNVNRTVLVPYANNQRQQQSSLQANTQLAINALPLFQAAGRGIMAVANWVGGWFGGSSSSDPNYTISAPSPGTYSGGPDDPNYQQTPNFSVGSGGIMGSPVFSLPDPTDPNPQGPVFV